MTACKRFDTTPRRRVRPARGIALIEMATVMAASLVLLAATATALASVHQAERRWSRQLDQLRSREQMLRQLRRDVHSAQDFKWNAADGSLRLTMAGGGEMTYERTAERWERRLKPPAAADKTEAVLKSAFPAPPDGAWQVTPADGGVGDLIRVRLVRSPKKSAQVDEDEPEAELVAVVGRDWRLLHE
jgi:hypothetical protein